MKEYLEANRKKWNELAQVHTERLYDVEGFVNGKTSLQDLELSEIGEVKGKSLLHLMCHIGIDTLSFARLGAHVTGIDFSEKAIESAIHISEKTGLQGEFIQSDLYELPQKLSAKYDIVYTSYGVLCWLPDLDKWGKIISSYLKPGGMFYIAEFHPFAWCFDNTDDCNSIRPCYSYFNKSEPLHFQESASYMEGESNLRNIDSYEWNHSLSDIFSALIRNGLEIKHFHEFRHCCYRMFTCMQKQSNSDWMLPKEAPDIPLTFSLKAVKSS